MMRNPEPDGTRIVPSWLMLVVSFALTKVPSGESISSSLPDGESKDMVSSCCVVTAEDEVEVMDTEMDDPKCKGGSSIDCRPFDNAPVGEDDDDVTALGSMLERKKISSLSRLSMALFMFDVSQRELCLDLAGHYGVSKVINQLRCSCCYRNAINPSHTHRPSILCLQPLL